MSASDAGRRSMTAYARMNARYCVAAPADLTKLHLEAPKRPLLMMVL